ncbi:MAG: hypothetical protein CBC33_000240 [Coraliomargarita sp. TMED73]|nr:MAG: hypothetical protein CBC33_000240 [Coraliomargarita sp. TMED73]|tara:strand:- start:168 stop:434 length:267 start_codon:yes stop_codon:yes gene_type:complete
MKKGDIVTVVTLAGEMIGKFNNSGAGTITLDDPRMLIQNEQGMGFAHGICVTGKNNPTEITFQSYVFVTPTNEDIEKAYRQAVSGLVL